LAILLLVAVGMACVREPPTRESGGLVAPATPRSALRSSATPGAPDATAVPSPDAGLPNVGSLASPAPPPQVYVVQAGDTLSAISRRFGVSLDALISANSLANPNALQVGQKLSIPSTQSEVAPSAWLLPDSEFVNGPGYVGFDAASVCDRHAGYLCGYSERVAGQLLTGPEVVERISQDYSVGPRLLLAVMESLSGWVTNPSPGAQAMGPAGGSGLLSQQLARAANELNQGYYNWRGRGVAPISWGDGSATAYAPGLNAATAGLYHFYSLSAGKARWLALVGDGPDSFSAAYRSLFGDPARYAVEPLIPAGTSLPDLDLPWPEGELWYYTSGPHGGWGEGSAWSAVDFVPDEGYLGCAVAKSWDVAAAPGIVVKSDEGQVLLDLDGDGHEETGWVLLYLHVAEQGRVKDGARLERGDHIGHPSCEGGYGNATHLHFARKYNGEWIAADGPLPLILSGWQFHSSGTSYDGTATRKDQERTACECQRPDYNGLVAGR
jgi:LasA protease